MVRFDGRLAFQHFVETASLRHKRPPPNFLLLDSVWTHKRNLMAKVRTAAGMTLWCSAPRCSECPNPPPAATALSV